MGCLARIGCVTVVVVLAAIGWYTRDRWLDTVRAVRPVVARGPAWEPLSAAGAERTRRALERLSQPSGPVFSNASGGDVASYVFSALAKQLPPSADSVQAAVINDRLALRASVKLSDLGGASVLGPLAGLLADRERMQFGGTFHIVRPALGEYEVKELKLGELAVPEAAIPGLLRRVERGARPKGLSDDGLPLVIPPYLGDIRIANGKVTFYKTIP
jgi:hypothetical protein